jgi:hypothetical protein
MSHFFVKGCNNQIQIYNNIAKNKKPFDNIEIYNYDDSFFHYTNAKKMNKLLKYDKVIKLSDNKIKYKKQKIDNHDFLIKKTKIIENKCLNCNNTEYLKKINILTRSKMNLLLKKNILIHFYFAVCSSCEDYCNYKKIVCNDDVSKEIGKSCVDYINELVETKNYDKLNEFIEYFLNYYSSIKEIKTSKKYNKNFNK